MPTSRTTLQTMVRTYLSDREAALASGDGKVFFEDVLLGMFNPYYKVMGQKIGRRWADRTRENTDLTMVAGTAQYNWPIDPPIKEPFFIEGLDVNASNEPYEITPAPTMEAWGALDDSDDAQPIHYRILEVNGVLKLELRPNPDQADPIRITSLVGVRKFPATNSSTVDSDSSSGQAVLNVAATTPFEVYERVVVGEGTTREERGVISSISAGVSLTLAANLSNAHTAAQADVVELTTPFVDEEMEMVVALLIAARWKQKRGDVGRAQDLVEQAVGHLPIHDRTPPLKSGGFIQPWRI